MQSQLVIEIRNGVATDREITLKSGAKKRVWDQVGFVEMNEEVRKIRIPVDKDAGQAPYAAGKYCLALSSFEVGEYHSLEINPYRLSLIPLESSQPVRAVK